MTVILNGMLLVTEASLAHGLSVKNLYSEENSSFIIVPRGVARIFQRGGGGGSHCVKHNVFATEY